MKGQLINLANQHNRYKQPRSKVKQPDSVAASVLVRQFDNGYPLQLTFDNGVYGTPSFSEPVATMSDSFWSGPFEVIDVEETIPEPQAKYEPPDMQQETPEKTVPHNETTQTEPKEIPQPALLLREGSPSTSTTPNEQAILGNKEIMADLQAILQGEKNFNEHPTQVAPEQPTERAKSKIESAQPSHELSILDKIAENMRYANTFDLGTYPIEHRFKQFDQEMDKERRALVTKRQMVELPKDLPPQQDVEISKTEELTDLDKIKTAQVKREGEISTGEATKEDKTTQNDKQKAPLSSAEISSPPPSLEQDNGGVLGIPKADELMELDKIKTPKVLDEVKLAPTETTEEEKSTQTDEQTGKLPAAYAN